MNLHYTIICNNIYCIPSYLQSIIPFFTFYFTHPSLCFLINTPPIYTFHIFFILFLLSFTCPRCSSRQYYPIIPLYFLSLRYIHGSSIYSHWFFHVVSYLHFLHNTYMICYIFYKNSSTHRVFYVYVISYAPIYNFVITVVKVILSCFSRLLYCPCNISSFSFYLLKLPVLAAAPDKDSFHEFLWCTLIFIST